ncbi:MAG: VanZ family protein [Desulfatirhabdiaceae bacterium]|nr:VanZ family protein [Desulfatirhabdiaceae bacterium]
MMKSIVASTVTLSYTLAIFYLSAVSAGTLGMIYKRAGIIHGVGLLHVLSFVLMGFLIRFMFSTQFYRKWIQNPRLWSVCTTVFLAGVLEFLQWFMPTRHARARDLLLHAAGIFIFFIVDWGMERYGRQGRGGE